MPGKGKSEEWWQDPSHQHLFRCNATTRQGTQCLREAESGSAVCSLHGGDAPQVRRRAAERILMTADAAAENLIKWMNDPSVPIGTRAKIAGDLMDRVGLVAVQMHKILPMDGDDPIETLFQGILSDPEGLVEPPELPTGSVDQPIKVDPAQEALDRLNESWIPDADVVSIRPEAMGKVGPHDYRGRNREEVVNGNPRPAAPGDERRWRTPDDPA